MPVTTVRIEKDDLAWLDDVAGQQDLDRTTLIKRAIHKGVREILLEDSLARYEASKCSAWAAADDAHMGLWEFLAEMRKRGVQFRTDEAELERAIEELA